MDDNDLINQAYKQVLAKKSILESLKSLYQSYLELSQKSIFEKIFDDTSVHNPSEFIIETLIAKTPEGSRPIKIRMEIDHHKTPHLHIDYMENKHCASYDINSGKKLSGTIPHKDEKILKKWIKDNRDMLMRNWNILKNSPNPTIEPIVYPIR